MHYVYTSFFAHINGGLDGEGTHRVDVVVEYDDSDHDTETEPLRLLILEPGRVLTAETGGMDRSRGRREGGRIFNEWGWKHST